MVMMTTTMMMETMKMIMCTLYFKNYCVGYDDDHDNDDDNDTEDNNGYPLL